jgi:hypothetical protein
MQLRQVEDRAKEEIAQAKNTMKDEMQRQIVGIFASLAVENFLLIE